MRRTALALAAALTLASCGGDDDGGLGGGTSFDSADDIAAELGCDFQPGEPDNTFGTAPEETGDCDVDGDAVSIDLYEDDEHLRQALRQASTIGCGFAQAFGIDQFSYAAGANWSVSPEDNLDEDFAAEIADQLGGEAQTVEC